jgi:hypothetical protein
LLFLYNMQSFRILLQHQDVASVIHLSATDPLFQYFV